MGKSCQMVLLKVIIIYRFCPESNKKNSNKHKKQLKLKDEVGMAGPKSTQTRFVGIITSTIHPYACFLSSYMGRDRNKLTNHATIL